MTALCPKLLAATIFAVLVLGAGCTRQSPWPVVRIDKRADDWQVTLENQKILARYSAARMRSLVKDRITQLRLKDSDAVVATALDGRHAEKNTAFFRMTHAALLSTGRDRKTVRLRFAGRVEDVTIFADTPVLKIDYHQGGHNLDYHITGGSFVIYGEDEWQRQHGWPDKHPRIRNEYTESGSYYRSNWKLDGPNPLSYKGWMILGVCEPESGLGAALLLPADKVRWLKLVPGGFERWVEGPHTAYIYAVSGGAEEILSAGKKLVDHLGRQDT